MPSIKDDTTVEAIAREYTSNGRKKGLALQTIGYQDSYAIESGRGCNVVFSNVRIIAAIKRIDNKGAEKQERTVESIDKMQQDAYNLAMRTKQPSAAVSAGTAIARLYGMDKDAGIKAVEPPKFTLEEELELKAMAKRATLALSRGA